MFLFQNTAQLSNAVAPSQKNLTVILNIITSPQYGLTYNATPSLNSNAKEIPAMIHDLKNSEIGQLINKIKNKKQFYEDFASGSYSIIKNAAPGTKKEDLSRVIKTWGQSVILFYSGAAPDGGLSFSKIDDEKKRDKNFNTCMGSDKASEIVQNTVKQLISSAIDSIARAKQLVSTTAFIEINNLRESERVKTKKSMDDTVNDWIDKYRTDKTARALTN